jgi:hypothetical protein
MVKKEIVSYTAEELLQFARDNYPQYFIKPTKKLKKSVYFRRTVMYLLWDIGIKVGEIAKMLGESHANVSIALPRVRSYFSTDGATLFFECYNEFVNKFNSHKNQLSDAGITSVNEGVQSYS